MLISNVVGAGCDPACNGGMREGRFPVCQVFLDNSDPFMATSETIVNR